MMGGPLLVIAGQEYAIPLLKRWMNPPDHFRDISLHDNVVVREEQTGNAKRARPPGPPPSGLAEFAGRAD